MRLMQEFLLLLAVAMVLLLATIDLIFQRGKQNNGTD